MTRRSGDHPDELISASLAGELTELERGILNEHLATCSSCRDTLAAFTDQRRLVSGLRPMSPPRDLPMRIQAGIDAGHVPNAPWWRRSGSVVVITTSLAAVATAVLSIVVFFSNLQDGPVGQTSSPAASESVAPTASGSIAPSQGASPAATASASPLDLGSLRYLSLNGAPFEPLRLTFVTDATGASVATGIVSGQPIAAALSPDGMWLAYITVKGETGANDVWAVHLTDASVFHLGCSAAAPFTDRLVWAPNGRYLAYTLAGIDLGPSSGCEASGGSGTDAWDFSLETHERVQLTRDGNAYVADFIPGLAQNLAISFAAPQPWTISVPLDADPTNIPRQDGVFLPRYSADGNRAIYWSGTMASSGGSWRFSQGGMPQLSRDFGSSGPASPWLGTPLFDDLIPVGGEGFASGSFRWGPDSVSYAFWDGEWTGAPQSADGLHPNRTDVYGGMLGGGSPDGLSDSDRVALSLPDQAWIVDVALPPSPYQGYLAITVGMPSAGIGDPPSSILYYVFRDGSAVRIGGVIDPPPWNGPAVFEP